MGSTEHRERGTATESGRALRRPGPRAECLRSGKGRCESGLVEFEGTANVGIWGHWRARLMIEVCFHAWPPCGDLAAANRGIRLQVNCLTNEQPRPPEHDPHPILSPLRRH